MSGKLKPMTLKAIGTLSDDRSYYILVKESIAAEPLNEIMEKIGYGILYYGWDEIAKYNHSPINFKNKVNRIVTEKYDIDVVYAHNRIILIVRAPKEQQKIFKELIFAYSKMDE